MSPSEPVTVDAGGSLTITATPNTNYQFYCWVCSPNTFYMQQCPYNKYTITNIQSDLTLTAYFIDSQYNVFVRWKTLTQPTNNSGLFFNTTIPLRNETYNKFNYEIEIRFPSENTPASQGMFWSNDSGVIGIVNSNGTIKALLGVGGEGRIVEGQCCKYEIPYDNDLHKFYLGYEGEMNKVGHYENGSYSYVTLRHTELPYERTLQVKPPDVSPRSAEGKLILFGKNVGVDAETSDITYAMSIGKFTVTDIEGNLRYDFYPRVQMRVDVNGDKYIYSGGMFETVNSLYREVPLSNWEFPDREWVEVMAVWPS